MRRAKPNVVRFSDRKTIVPADAAEHREPAPADADELAATGRDYAWGAEDPARYAALGDHMARYMAQSLKRRIAARDTANPPAGTPERRRVELVCPDVDGEGAVSSAFTEQVVARRR